MYLRRNHSKKQLVAENTANSLHKKIKTFFSEHLFDPQPKKRKNFFFSEHLFLEKNKLTHYQKGVQRKKKFLRFFGCGSKGVQRKKSFFLSFSKMAWVLEERVLQSRLGNSETVGKVFTESWSKDYLRVTIRFPKSFVDFKTQHLCARKDFACGNFFIFLFLREKLHNFQASK